MRIAAIAVMTVLPALVSAQTSDSLPASVLAVQPSVFRSSVPGRASTTWGDRAKHGAKVGALVGGGGGLVLGLIFSDANGDDNDKLTLPLELAAVGAAGGALLGAALASVPAFERTRERAVAPNFSTDLRRTRLGVHVRF